MQRQKRFLSEEEIERITTDLLVQGYDQDRIIDHLEHINKQREKKEAREPKHVSSVMDEVMSRLNRLKQ